MTNPKENYFSHKDAIDEDVQKVISSGMYIGGEQVELFELEWASYCGTKHCAAVANGTDAITLALKACGVGHGDQVITVSFTVSATIAAIYLAGATPVLVDINPATLTMDTDQLDKAVNKHTKAIVPVHLFGWPADVITIGIFAGEKELWVIEDCAHAHGGSYMKYRPGAWGDVGAFSFYPTKNLGALGDAGAIVTSNPKLAAGVMMLREYGWDMGARYDTVIPRGCNSRMDEIQAAVLRAKLPFLDDEIARRRVLAEIYHEELGRVLDVTLPPNNPEFHAYHKFTIRHPRRDELRESLREKGIPSTIYYEKPIHMQKAYAHTPRVGDLPETEQAAKEVISLPLWPEMSESYVCYVCEVIKRA